MVEVALDSAEINHLIKWYTFIYGNTKKVKPTAEDISVLHKLEVMRTALAQEEADYKQMMRG